MATLDVWGKGGTQYSRNIGTLDPARLTAADYMELTGFSTAIYDRQFLKWNPNSRTWGRLADSIDKPFTSMIRYLTPSTKTGVNSRNFAAGVARTYEGTEWPPTARGFLYFWHRPDLSVKTGHLRFRVVHTGDPRRFNLSQDLLLPWGLPWSVPVLACTKQTYRLFAEVLIRDGLLNEEDIKALEADVEKLNLRNNIIYSLYQPFYVNFETSHVRMSIVGEGPHSTLRMSIFFQEGRMAHRSKAPWAGRAICQLEPSRLPEERGKNMVHLRILKLLEPVRCLIDYYDEYIEKPTEGELVAKLGRPQSANITNTADPGAIVRFMATAEAALKDNSTLLPQSENQSSPEADQHAPVQS